MQGTAWVKTQILWIMVSTAVVGQTAPLHTTVFNLATAEGNVVIASLNTTHDPQWNAGCGSYVHGSAAVVRDLAAGYLTLGLQVTGDAREGLCNGSTSMPLLRAETTTTRYTAASGFLTFSRNETLPLVSVAASSSPLLSATIGTTHVVKPQIEPLQHWDVNEAYRASWTSPTCDAVLTSTDLQVDPSLGLAYRWSRTSSSSSPSPPPSVAGGPWSRTSRLKAVPEASFVGYGMASAGEGEWSAVYAPWENTLRGEVHLFNATAYVGTLPRPPTFNADTDDVGCYYCMCARHGLLVVRAGEALAVYTLASPLVGWMWAASIPLPGAIVGKAVLCALTGLRLAVTDLRDGGSVLVFAAANGTAGAWVLEAHLRGNATEHGGLLPLVDFGRSLALRGDRLVITDATAKNNTGLALLYARSEAEGTWSFLRACVPEGSVPGDLFGVAVALGKDALVLGGLQRPALWVFRGLSSSEESALPLPSAVSSQDLGLPLDGGMWPFGTVSLDECNGTFLASGLSVGTVYAFELDRVLTVAVTITLVDPWQTLPPVDKPPPPPPPPPAAWLLAAPCNATCTQSGVRSEVAGSLRFIACPPLACGDATDHAARAAALDARLSLAESEVAVLGVTTALLAVLLLLFFAACLVACLCRQTTVKRIGRQNEFERTSMHALTGRSAKAPPAPSRPPTPTQPTTFDPPSPRSVNSESPAAE